MHGLSACAKEPSTQATNEESPATTPYLDLHKVAEKTLTADIDGDKKKDSIYFILKNKVAPLSLLEKANIIQPFFSEKRSDGDLKSGSKHIIYFDLSSIGNDFLIHDTNEISVLDTEAASSILTASNKELNAILEDSDSSSPGDGIILPTEAGIDLYLYWDGQSISLFEPMDLP